MKTNDRKDTLKLCTEIFAGWIICEENSKYYSGKSEYSQKSFIAQLLRKRMEVFKIPVLMHDKLLMLIEICTDGNPGKAQMMLKMLLGKNRKQDSRITPGDFVSIFASEFPVISLYPQWQKAFDEMWMKQKEVSTGTNLCDRPEWWMEAFAD